METPSIYLTSNSFRTFVKAFNSAIDNRDSETFTLLNSFVYKRISAAYEADNLKGLEDFTAFFVINYEYALNKLKGDSVTYRDIYEVCADRAARGLKEKAGYGFRNRFSSQETNPEEKLKLNRYTKIILNRFSDLLYTCLRKNDFTRLPEILNQLRQISERYNHQLTKLKWEIYTIRSKSPVGEELKVLRELESTYEIESYVGTTVRLVIKASFFWAFYLYTTQTITFAEYEALLKTFEEYKGYIEHDLVEDLIRLRDMSKVDEYSWSRWDYKDRMDGKVYSPPTVSNWVTLGSVVYILRNKVFIDFDQQIKNSNFIDSFEYLISSMQDIVNNLKKSDDEELRKIINVNNKEEFEARLNSISNRFEHLKKSAYSVKEERLVNLPLDSGYVQNFKEEISREWEIQNSIRQLFNYFKNVTTINENEEVPEMLLIGERNKVWLGSKTNFVKEPDLHVPIFGMDAHGRDLARFEENLFLSVLMESSSTEVDDIILSIDKAKETISNKEGLVSVILIGSNVWYKISQHSNSPDFDITNKTTKFPVAGFRGFYKNIPLIQLSSELSNDILVVTDFEKAFALTQREIKDSYQNIFKIAVEEITQFDAESLIKKYPDYWKREIPEGDAIVKLRNSVKVDLYLIEKFEINNPDAYVLMFLRDPYRFES